MSSIQVDIQAAHFRLTVPPLNVPPDVPFDT